MSSMTRRNTPEKDGQTEAVHEPGPDGQSRFRRPRGRRPEMDQFLRQLNGSTRYSFASIEAKLYSTNPKR